MEELLFWARALGWLIWSLGDHRGFWGLWAFLGGVGGLLLVALLAARRR